MGLPATSYDLLFGGCSPLTAILFRNTPRRCFVEWISVLMDAVPIPNDLHRGMTSSHHPDLRDCTKEFYLPFEAKHPTE